MWTRILNRLLKLRFRLSSNENDKLLLLLAKRCRSHCRRLSIQPLDPEPKGSLLSDVDIIKGGERFRSELHEADLEGSRPSDLHIVKSINDYVK
ncbi:hypothetical protein QVD17_24773 [Tagetes erecta]|uniref:Uncharacterized protein n=1 Tax=Tagetes erecta TaxID=13708 RepID=A0AAD8NUQ6_TARER|nr:hypothetical protein QVD17_24773 [Tagetes erecta]